MPDAAAFAWAQVPPGHVWLQGDNALNSTDSRSYGPVPYALIEGRAFLKVREHAPPRIAALLTQLI